MVKALAIALMMLTANGTTLHGYESRENPGQYHEKWSSWRVPYFKFVRCCYELSAIPEACGRFHGAQIGKAGNSEGQPPQARY